jgi:hypothetical protein
MSTYARSNRTVLRPPVEPGLAAVVGVMDQLTCGLAPPKRHHQRSNDKVGGLTFTHRPAHDAAVVEITDAGEVEPAIETPELGDVGHPAQVRRGSGEVPFEQIGRGHHAVVAAAPFSSPMYAHEAIDAHQAGDAVP